MFKTQVQYSDHQKRRRWRQKAAKNRCVYCSNYSLFCLISSSSAISYYWMFFCRLTMQFFFHLDGSLLRMSFSEYDRSSWYRIEILDSTDPFLNTVDLTTLGWHDIIWLWPLNELVEFGDEVALREEMKELMSNDASRRSLSILFHRPSSMKNRNTNDTEGIFNDDLAMNLVYMTEVLIFMKACVILTHREQVLCEIQCTTLNTMHPWVLDRNIGWMSLLWLLSSNANTDLCIVFLSCFPSAHCPLLMQEKHIIYFVNHLIPLTAFLERLLRFDRDSYFSYQRDTLHHPMKVWLYGVISILV